MTKKLGRTDTRYHYTECGLDNIYLRNGFEYLPSKRGSSIRIHDVEGLHRAIGEMLLWDKKHLDGKEFRFLRSELNMTQQNLAILLGVDAQSVARWEKEHSKRIPGPAQALVRLLYAEKLNGNQKICEPLARLAELDELEACDEQVDFSQDNEKWESALAA